MPAPANPINIRHNGLSVREQFAVLQLSPSDKRKALLNAGKAVRKHSRQRIRQQKTLSGQSMAARKNRRKRKKMLRGLSRTMGVQANANQAVIGWRNPVTGAIAKRQQEGLSQTMTSRDLPKITRATYDEPCPKNIARALIRAGFTIKRKRGKGHKRPSLAWITEHLTFGMAGAILRELTDKPQQSRWRIPLAARPFLGATNDDMNQILDAQLRAFLQAMR